MKSFTVSERLNPNLKNALFSNFGSATDALQEIIDNSVSQRTPGKKLQIKLYFIEKRPQKIEIHDVGGKGMDPSTLKFFFNWGGTRTRSAQDIGMYGQGGKSAIGYLGRAFTLSTSPSQTMEAYELEDLNLWDTTKLKEYKIYPTKAYTEEGYTKIVIERLRFSITENFKQKVRDSLVNTYRPLIMSGEVELIINGEPIKTPKFPLDSAFSIEKVQFLVNDRQTVRGWIGRLNTRTGLKGGIRCYYKGRLIKEREFFGHPDPTYKGTLNFLIGEIFLNFVPVNTNKTDFHRDSPEWREVEVKMNTLLKPHIDELLGRKIEEPSEEEVKRIKSTRDLFRQIMSILQKRQETGLSLGGEDQGQKVPERSGEISSRPGKAPTGKKQQPRTPPPTNKVGIRRRLKNFMDWDVRPMEGSTRSKIEETESGKILVVNNIYPGYKVMNGNEFYLLETAALQVLPIEDEVMSPKKYLEEFDVFFGEICKHVDEAKQILRQKRKTW